MNASKLRQLTSSVLAKFVRDFSFVASCSFSENFVKASRAKQKMVKTEQSMLS
jgi:hypothetical protein